jgi:chloramphenicol 3-O phosphotransferase
MNKMSQNLGKIILLNGASSAGKSTLCRAIQAQADEPFLQFSPDFFMFKTEILPRRRDEGGVFAWEAMRPKVFEGYYNCLPALARAGNNLVLDYVMEAKEQLEALVERLEGFDVFYVGVHCPPDELIRREKLRGDRGTGDAQRDFETVHSFSGYDLEVDSMLPAQENAGRILEAWKKQDGSSVFAQLRVGRM